MSLTTSEMTPADIAAVTGGSSGYGNGFDGDGWWIILFLILAMGGNWGNGFGGNGWNGGGSVPWIMNTDNDVERGFNQMATTNGIQNLQNAVNSGFANASTQLCNCCSDIQMALCNGFAGVEQGANSRQMANMNQNFALQTAMLQGFNGVGTQLSDCCCENRLGIADLKYTVATENCADRQALNEGVRDIIASQTAGTQRILDQLCADKIDAKNDEIAQLRQELLYARGQASQDVQTAVLRQGQEAEVDALYNRLNNCPVGTVPVYGRQPIFTCNNNGCGCGTGCGM